METINVSFTENEAQVLIQLIDLAVKSQGLNAAEAGLILTRKIQEQMPKTDGANASVANSSVANSSVANSSVANSSVFPTGPQ
jgi:hypothetical protein